MKKKVLSIMLCLALTASAVGCGSGGSEDNGEKPEEAELNILMSFPQYMEQWEGYCRQFEEKMLEEENIKVKVNLEMPSSDQYDSVLQTRLTGDDAPDLFTIHANNIAKYTEAGYLADLTGSEGVSKVYDDVKKTVMVDEKVMAVPIESTAWGVVYNKEMFEDAGVELPETLDDLRQVCEKLKAKGYTPFMLAFQEQWVPQLMTALTLGGLVSGEKTDWLDRMYEDQGSYEEVKEIFDVIDLIMENGTDRAMEEGAEMGAADFANGKAAMYVNGFSTATMMETNPDLQIGMFPLPVNDNEECTKINLSTSTVLGVYEGGEQKELAMKFADYVLDDEDSSQLFQDCGFNPIAPCHDYETTPWVQEAYKYVEEGRSYQDLVLPSAVTDEQGKLLQELYVGNVTVDDIIPRLDQAFQEANKLAQ